MQQITHRIKTEPVLLVINDCPLNVFRKTGFGDNDRRLESCSKCDYFFNQDHCGYELYKTELIKRASECEDDECYGMPQTNYSWDFKCAKCGKTIHFSSGFSVLVLGDTEQCFHCKTKHRLIRHEGNEYEFAIPMTV